MPTITLPLHEYEEMKTELSEMRKFVNDQDLVYIKYDFGYTTMIIVKDWQSELIDAKKEIDRLKKRNLIQRIFNT